MLADQPATRGEETVCFIGSSSIRLWDLKRSFPELNSVNCGFGGSHLADATYYLDQLVFSHEPTMVVLYAGDNDIAAGLSTDQVVSDYQSFVAKLRTKLPAVKLCYVAIKPSVARWEKYELMREANRRIAAIIEQDALAEFVTWARSCSVTMVSPSRNCLWPMVCT